MRRKRKKKRPSGQHVAGDATNFMAVYKEGSDLLHCGEPQQATPLLERAVALNPEHIDASINLSGAYIMTKRFRQAVVTLEALQEVAAENEMLWTNLGAAYLGNPVLAKDADQRRAIAAFERALSVNPVAPNVAYNIGLIYRDRRNLERASHWFERALQANPHDRDARALLGRLVQTARPAADEEE